MTVRIVRKPGNGMIAKGGGDRGGHTEPATISDPQKERLLVGNQRQDNKDLKGPGGSLQKGAGTGTGGGGRKTET